MFTASSHAKPPTLNTTTSAAASRTLGALLVVEALLSFAPIAILGPSIGWPASLGRPVADQMAAIHANAGAVALGYGLYLLYSILIVPVMIALAARSLGGLHRPLAATVAALATMSALARSIGILRWLTVMPALAAAHAAADPTQASDLQLVFRSLNQYGGGVGELLGVSLFMGLALALLCLGAWRSGGLPRPLAASGVVTALMLLALSAPTWGARSTVPVAVAVSALSLWMLAAGVWSLLRPGHRVP
jgi:Domain of unknown function (DUF4386)